MIRKLSYIKYLLVLQVFLFAGCTPTPSWFKYIENSDISSLNELEEEEGIYFYEYGSAGRFCFHVATKAGALESVNWLIQHGADLSVRDRKGDTPLHYAVRFGQYKIADLLLKNGADVDAVSWSTPLINAVQKNDMNMVQLLLDAGADTELVANGSTALLESIAAGNEQMYKLLIDNGADVNGPQSQVKASPLHWAITHNDGDFIKYLVESGADINLRDAGGTTPLNASIYNSNMDYMKTLIELGADLSSFTKKGEPLLFHLIILKKYDFMDVLLASGSDPLLENPRGISIYEFCTASGDSKALEVLLKYLPHEKASTVLGDALIVSMYKIDSTSASRLIECGADVNHLNREGISPLIASVIEGDIGNVRLLLDAGADVELRVRNNMTALKYAEDKGKDEILSLLRERKKGVCEY